MSEVTLVIVGAGGHGKVCAEIAAALDHYDLIVFSDNAMDRGSAVLEWSVRYHDADFSRLELQSMEFIIGTGQVGTGGQREQLYRWLQELRARIATLTSRTAVVSPSALVGAGTIIGNRALVQAAAAIGANCIVNSHALVEHDSRIGDHVHLSTGCIVNGGATVGDRCLVGSGAIVNHGVAVCADAIIGSGAVVVANVETPGTYVGIPARKIRHA
jgi:sugar O-acyltransferase (sialic acid O-acetyltransferase NeuD family)